MACNFPFLVVIMSGFGIGAMLALWNESESVLFWFLEEFEEE